MHDRRPIVHFVGKPFLAIFGMAGGDHLLPSFRQQKEQGDLGFLLPEEEQVQVDSLKQLKAANVKHAETILELDRHRTLLRIQTDITQEYREQASWFYLAAIYFFGFRVPSPLSVQNLHRLCDARHLKVDDEGLCRDSLLQEGSNQA
jgi:hypothetical protein